LAAAATVPLLGSAFAAPVFAADRRPRAPYLALEKFVHPGGDEFPEEGAALETVKQLTEAFDSGRLPLSGECSGFSPAAKHDAPIANDVSEARFDHTDRDLAGGWARWRASLGEVRRFQFFALPDNVIRFEIASSGREGLQYRVGTWRLLWENGRIVHFEPLEQQTATAAEPWFLDVTSPVFGGAKSFTDQLLPGIPYWRCRLDPASGIDIYGSNGVAAGDIDGDGLDEIYVCQPGGLPNRLYKVRGDQTFADITDTWGVGLLDDSSSAIFADLRNSGFQDLVLLRPGGPLLFINDGARFSLRTDAFRFHTPPAGGFTGMSAADFDRDGKLDLYLCCYVYFQSEAQYTYAVPYHDAQNGPPNFLFRNKLNADGTGFFEDCTEETGINENNNRFSFSAAWCDFNGDGWPDVFVANDFGRKNLYVNRNGHFHDGAAEAGVEDMGPGMSAHWFDYNGDGNPDVYVSNMWTDAGQRVASSPNFKPAAAAGALAYRRHSMGNSLYRNHGDGTFENVTMMEHAGFGRWAWASGGHDFNNDGRPELLIGCGMLTNGSDSTEDLNSFFWRQVVARSPATARPSAEYENGWNALNQFVREECHWNGHEPNVFHARRGERYYDFSGVSGADFADDCRAFAVVDFDGDGRTDVILKSRMGPQVRVLRNNCAAGSSIAVVLRGTKSNRDGIGAKVQVNRQTKWVEAGSGFLSQHSKRLIFGLGDLQAASVVKVKWPSGLEQEWTNLAAGGTHVLTEGVAATASKPFLPRQPLVAAPVRGINRQQLHDTWLMEPIPLPETVKGARLLVLCDHATQAAAAPRWAKVLDFSAEPPARRELYEIFRRYWFDWRAPLATPAALLLNADGEAVKIYNHVPSDAEASADRDSAAGTAQDRSLPFRGTYFKTPSRDFFKFGAAFLWAGHTQEALPYLLRVLDKDGTNARVLVLVGQIYVDGGRMDEAEKAFRSVLEINPSNAEGWMGLGDVLDSRGQFEQAFDHYRKAIAIKPDLLYAMLNAGRVAAKLERQALAEALYRQAAAAYPESAEAANGVGLALAKQGNFGEAGTWLKRAIELKRDYGEAINNLAVLYLQTGKPNDAIAAFQYGIEQAPDEDILYLNLGRAYAQQRDFDKARDVMKRLLERKPDSVVARHALDELKGR
jgi:Flp pilus assembly protein TadD